MLVEKIVRLFLGIAYVVMLAGAKMESEQDIYVEEEVESEIVEELDWNVFGEVLSEDDWTSFQEYLPVLNGTQTFEWNSTWEDEKNETTILEYIKEYYVDLDEAETTPNFGINEIAIEDLDSDGIKELVIEYVWLNDYLVLHSENGKIYGRDFTCRAFQMLQKNGVYNATGGAAYNYLYQLSFQNGEFVSTPLGFMEEDVCSIGGEETDLDTYEAWREEIMVGDVAWYNIKNPEGVKGYLSELDMHPLYLDFLQNKLQVENPHTIGMEGYNGYLSFFDEKEYEDGFNNVEKTFAFCDINEDGEEELIFCIEDRESPDELMYILGIREEELVCYDVFETRTSNMGFRVYEHGSMLDTLGDVVYYGYDSEGKPYEKSEDEYMGNELFFYDCRNFWDSPVE